jgi:replicative DNA helicase
MQTKDFLFDLCPKGKWKVEFSDAHKTYNFEEVMKLEKDVYYLASVSDPSKRNKDNDVIWKRYFVIDIDIRDILSQDWDCPDEAIEMTSEVIIQKLADWYNDWKYLVFTGNWVHFYWVWEWWKYNPEEYKMFVEYHYEKINKLLEWIWLTVDDACKNIGRLLRLPWTKNYKRQSKYWLDPVECVIWKKQEIYTNKFWDFDKIVQQQKNNKLVKETQRQIKNSMKSVSDDVLEDILAIDIWELIDWYNWLQPQKDMKNIKSPKDNSNIWAFVHENVLYITGTHYFKDDHNWYNPFTFVKTHYWLSNSETFDWFKERYNHLRKDKKTDKVVVDDYKKYFMSYGELLKRGKQFRRSITLDNVSKYGIKWLDDYIWGILPDELVVIWARPWVWKSEIAYNISTMNAERWKKVMLFTLEGNIEEPAIRHLQKEISKKKEVSPIQYRFNTVDVIKEEDAAEQNISENIKNNLYVFKKENIPTLSLLKDLIIKAKDNVDLIVIDHLHYIHLEKDNENKEIWEIMRELKVITDIIKKPVVLVSHLRKPSTKEINETPTKFDLYWSSNISKEATTIILITKTTLNNTQTLDDSNSDRYAGTQFIVDKSRALGNRTLIINGAYDMWKKCYIDTERSMDEESNVKASEKISFN